MPASAGRFVSGLVLALPRTDAFRCRRVVVGAPAGCSGGAELLGVLEVEANEEVLEGGLELFVGVVLGQRRA
ncbi:hypothetical protein GCM10027039_19540 [Terrabacter koreensis]